MDFNNKHIVLIILIIIIFVFIYNYDIYVIEKGEPLCKPIYIVKKELSPKILNDLSEFEKVAISEALTTDYVGNIDLNSNPNNEFKLPSKSLLSFAQNNLEIKDPNKLNVMDSVVKVLSYIPTNLSEKQIEEMLQYFSVIYQSSDSLNSFYNTISSSTKINSSPYNTKYSQLILFLIGKFNNDYTMCNTAKYIETIHVVPSNVKIVPTQIEQHNIEQHNTEQHNIEQSNIENEIISEIENEIDKEFTSTIMLQQGKKKRKNKGKIKNIRFDDSQSMNNNNCNCLTECNTQLESYNNIGYDSFAHI